MILGQCPAGRSYFPLLFQSAPNRVGVKDPISRSVIAGLETLSCSLCGSSPPILPRCHRAHHAQEFQCVPCSHVNHAVQPQKILSPQARSPPIAISLMTSTPTTNATSSNHRVAANSLSAGDSHPPSAYLNASASKKRSKRSRRREKMDLPLPPTPPPEDDENTAIQTYSDENRLSRVSTVRYWNVLVSTYGVLDSYIWKQCSNNQAK